MLNLIKQIVKTVVPAPVLTSGMIARERRRVAKLAKAHFQPQPLRAMSRSQLDTAFINDALGRAWEQDLAKISRVMPYADIYGGVCPGERRAIYQMIAWLKPHRVLEIGTHIGASTLVIAQALASHADADSRMVTGDILDVNNPTQGAFRQLGTTSPRQGLHVLGLDNRVRFEVMPALKLMKDLNEKFDFIFLDGDHSATAVYQEISAALEILAENGLILLHDFYPKGNGLYPNGLVVPGPFIGAARVKNECPAINFMPLGELPWETKQGVRRTSLALVSK